VSDDGGARRRSLQNSDDVDVHATNEWEEAHQTAVEKGDEKRQEECRVILEVANLHLAWGWRHLGGRYLGEKVVWRFRSSA
jgi:hypothetical protein